MKKHNFMEVTPDGFEKGHINLPLLEIEAVHPQVSGATEIVMSTGKKFLVKEHEEEARRLWKEAVEAHQHQPAGHDRHEHQAKPAAK